MLLETGVDVVLLRQKIIKDEDGNAVLENGRPKVQLKVMFFDNNEGYILPGGPIPEITPEQCDGCDPFDDNAPAEFLAMSIVEHLTGLGPEHIEDATYHQYRWKICTDHNDPEWKTQKKGKAVVYYYAFIREETDAETAAVDELLAEKYDVKFFSEEELDSPTFIWGGGKKDEETVREIFSLFKPHIEQ